MALQANGKIVVSGFIAIGSKRFALCRIQPDGDLDLNFGITSDSDPVSPALSLMPDGGVLVGRKPSSGDYALQRIMNPYQLIDSLIFDGSEVLWLRDGACPELCHTLFEVSTNGSHFVELGPGERCQGGWRLSGLQLPTNATIRARGYVTTHKSAWFVERAVGAPVIIMQPTDRLVITGGPVYFEVDAVGGPP